MRTIAEILGTLTGVYMLLIMVRIIITWFSRGNYGRPYEILCGITDPYLNWFRRFTSLRAGNMDLSPIAAFAVLSLAQNIFMTLSSYGRITVGIILALILSAAWSMVSFVLGFFIITLILRFVAVIFRLGGGIFWNIVDTISRPVLYRFQRFFFRNRLVNYRIGMIVPIVVLVFTYILGDRLVKLALFPLLIRLPL